MEKINISIIIPVFNVEEYLRECLDSITQLKAVTWEAILVDDGSTDTSGQFCDEYAKQDSRFRVIHQKNAGVSAARNAGLDAAKCDWIWFVDSDDSINPDFEISNPEMLDTADYVLFDMRQFRDGEELNSLEHQKDTVKFADLSKNDFLCKYQCNHHQRIFYKKTLVMNDHHQCLAFSLGTRVGEDLEFQYKYLTRCQRPARLDAVLYNYRLREGSATQDDSYRRKNLEDLPQVIERLLNWCKDENVKPEPWLEMRIQQMFQNLLYSASLVKGVNKKALQSTVRQFLDAWSKQGFAFPKSSKMKLAHWSVAAYFVFNKIYLKLKGIK